MNVPNKEHLDQHLMTIAGVSFDQLPSEMRCTAFGVDYAHICPPEGGDLLVTRHGWHFLLQLLPGNWYADRWYGEQGERLKGATGAVYRVPTRPVHGKSIDVVVKFSRVGQQVLLDVATSFPDNIPPEDIASACFNSPLEEFGLVMEMRRGMYGPKGIRIMAQRPLAIYAPPEEIHLWQSGRSTWHFDAHQRLLAEDQQKLDKAIELDIKRKYILLFGWIKGMDAEEAYGHDLICERELHNLTVRVIGELRSKGFRVLDNKPKHFIVREDRQNGGLMKREGRIAYGLVDFELLQRTRSHQHQFKLIQRTKYWQMQSHRSDAKPQALLPPHLNPSRILGVNYIVGTPPSGGKLWVVGNEAGLFDYFLPMRWRRTPRVKLSPANEVYRTRTRDNIHVVYQRSRVGEEPRSDPGQPCSERIREHGYNSPFEEVAIAELLRRSGIATVYPRAVYRTDHHSTRAAYILDERRYVTHADLMMPGPERECVLVRDYDYYTIWSDFRGLDPATRRREHGDPGFVDVKTARKTDLLTEEEYEHIVGVTLHRLATIGVASEDYTASGLLLRLDDDGTLHREANGDLDVTLSLDALTALKGNVIDARTHEALVHNIEMKLESVGCEALNLDGHHLLLSMNPDGVLEKDPSGTPKATLCNFELIRVRSGALQ